MSPHLNGSYAASGMAVDEAVICETLRGHRAVHLPDLGHRLVELARLGTARVLVPEGPEDRYNRWLSSGATDYDASSRWRLSERRSSQQSCRTRHLRGAARPIRITRCAVELTGW